MGKTLRKLWEKTYSVNKRAEEYMFGDTAFTDEALTVYDATGSCGHARMLEKIGILTHQEYIQIKKALSEIVCLSKKGKFSVAVVDEDIHTKIENYLTEKLGEIGKKIHTGRSRNDQILTDLRLYSKDKTIFVALKSLNLAETFLHFAARYEFVVMPGYTHMQKAMPSSVGMWAGSFVESLVDDLEVLKTSYKINDQSPLGSGAAYGVPLPVDREYTSKILGFSNVQNNSLYVQSSRGKFHLILMHAMTQIMLTLSRFAQDLLLFTTDGFRFFTMDEKICTGSSIMPQKRNLDILEEVRARTHSVISYEHMIDSIISGLPSGYNADFGETKFPFMKSIGITNSAISVCKLVLESIKPNEEVLASFCSPEIFATHAVYERVKNGMCFRDAYRKVGRSLQTIPKYDAKDIIKLSYHTGDTGTLGLKKLRSKIILQKIWWEKCRQSFQEINISRM